MYTMILVLMFNLPNKSVFRSIKEVDIHPGVWVFE